MKNKFIKSTIILIIGGLITKILGMIIKIVLTRTIGTEGISLYMLVLPTFNLFITLCNLGVPIAITKLISEKKNSSKKIVIPTTIIVLLYDIILVIIILFIAKYLANYLLHNNSVYYPLIAIGSTLPFITLSSIIKGYFFGKEKVFPITLSNVIEQIARLVLTTTIVAKMMTYSLVAALTTVVLINIISEGVSIILLLIFLPKDKITKEDLSIRDNKLLKEIFEISIPNTMARLIGSVTYFFEPIILTNILRYVGYSSNYITTTYGIINGYVYPLLLLPSFFTLAISSAILPVISNSYSNKNYSYTKKKIREAIFFSLLVGIPATLIFIFIPDVPLKLVYNTTLGTEYIKITAPFFLLHYIQAPLTSSLNGMGYSKTAMKGTLYGGIIKILSLVIFSLLKIGLWSLIISTILNVVVVTIHHIYYVRKYLKSPTMM